MNKTIIAILVTTITGTTAASLLADDREDHERNEHEEYEGNRQAYGYNGEREENERGLSGWLLSLQSGVHSEDTGIAYLADERHPLYLSECGSCHMAYPPTMLPAVSWQAMMATLDNHFGENAELDLETRSQIENYLGEHAAGTGGSGDYAERMWRATRGMAAPQRITDTDYFRGKHHELGPKMVQDNPEVKSFSRCEACHSRAAEGSFAEHEVRIPGYGRWDD